MPRMLDLFAGLGGWSAAFRDRGWEVVTLDIDPRFHPTIAADILAPEVPSILAAWGPFDVVTASPPCEGFTVMQISRNWTRPDDDPPHQPKTDKARLALAIVQATRVIVAGLDPAYWVLENPVGKLRKLPVVADLERRQVTYCQLGESRMKPTDLWSDRWPPSLVLPAPCRQGDPCHVSAPRGSKTAGSTQDPKHTAATRAEVPYRLSELFAQACEADLATPPEPCPRCGPYPTWNIRHHAPGCPLTPAVAGQVPLWA